MVQIREEGGQMLLATGIVLMLSLLSMAWFGVSVAGLGDPYDPGTEEVIDVTESFSDVWQSLIENRSSDFVSDGADWQISVDAAANSTASDLMRHGEHRGGEVILTDISALSSLTQLQSLVLSGTKITPEQKDQLKLCISTLSIY